MDFCPPPPNIGINQETYSGKMLCAACDTVDHKTTKKVRKVVGRSKNVPRRLLSLFHITQCFHIVVLCIVVKTVIVLLSLSALLYAC